jgi:hypothetical protein
MPFRAALLGVAVALTVLAACSGGQVQPTNPALPVSTASHGDAGVAPAARSAPQPILTPQPTAAPPPGWEDSLFVGQNWTKIFRFTNWTWSSDGYFFGNAVPAGLWSDRKYLYVSFWVPGTNNFVAEYHPNSTTPSFTYTNGLGTSIGSISTQVLGNVHYLFVAGSTSGFVKQFVRDTNTVIATCYSRGDVMGVAVDPSGNVFVDYYGSDNQGHIVEYAGGLTAWGGCNATLLPITFPGQVGEMVLDNAGRLVIGDILNGRVDIINPPYNSISGTLGSGFLVPSYLSIDFNNDRAFVSDSYGVHVLSYPSGSPQYSLGPSVGLWGPSGVVDWQNYGF